ncbi:MAG TPA: hypothetical protein VFU89_05070 [Rhabdochlamydiaceae bacterium]|nr:hypothetical protein [Rhabdochlamydiaceae bacterium]
MKMTEIEGHPAWEGKLSDKEIAFLLAGQQPFTYILSETANSGYLLSYVTAKQGIKQIPFRAVFDQNRRKQGYRNGNNTIFSSVDTLLRYKLKGRGLALKPDSLQLSA